MKKEIVLGPFPFKRAEQLLVKLQDSSGKFKSGARPYIGDLKKSHGYGKKIGLLSHDVKIKTRIDWDPEKQVHFNYEDSENGLKVCIRISDWSFEDYKSYIEYMNKGIDDSSVEKQLWKSRREENMDLSGYLQTTTMCNKQLFRAPLKLYRDKKIGQIVEEVIEKASCLR